MEPATARLVGRDRELERLREFLAEAASDGGALLVAGEAGAGKTALLDEAAAEAGAAGTTVVRGAGIEFEAEVGFAGLHQLVQPLWSGGLDELPAPQARALGVALGLEDGAAPDRLALANAVTSLLRNASSTAPLLLVVDDMQWLDPASATLLGLVGRRLAGSRVGLLGGVRTGENSLVESSGFDELTVERLDDAAAAALLSERFPDLGDRDRSRLLAEAEGNALALVELPRGLGDPGAQQPTPVGRRLRSHFARRIGTLPESVREQLLLAALSGGSTGELADLDAAEGAGIVRRTQGGVVFRHPLARAAVVEASVHCLLYTSPSPRDS